MIVTVICTTHGLALITVKMPSVTFVLDYLKTSNLTDTARYLVNLPECENANEGSVLSSVRRLKEKANDLRVRATRPKGKEALAAFLDGPFQFPPSDAQKQLNAR